MRNQSSWLLLVSIFALAACHHSNSPAPGPTVTAEGGIDSGGGNFIGSEPTQIRAIFNGDHGFNLKATVKDVFETVARQVRNKEVTPDLESIFSRLLGRKYGGDAVEIREDIERSAYELKESGPCLNDAHRGFTDASARLDQKFTPVCFSLDALKRFPIQAVPFQLVALAVHEHAHHYGFDEEDAVKAQTAVLNTMNYKLMSEVFIDAISTAAAVRERSRHLVDQLDSSLTDKLVCKHLAALDADALRLFVLADKVSRQFELRMLVTALTPNFGLNDRSLTGTSELQKDTTKALGFCGDDKLTEREHFDLLPEGDRAQLKSLLGQISAAANAIVSRAAKN